jgi:hypothetical protein
MLRAFAEDTSSEKKSTAAHGVRTFKVAARKLSATTARPNL